MTRFNIGDRVRIILSCSRYGYSAAIVGGPPVSFNVRPGDAGTVSERTSNNYHVVFDTHPFSTVSVRPGLLEACDGRGPPPKPVIGPPITLEIT